MDSRLTRHVAIATVAIAWWALVAGVVSAQPQQSRPSLLVSDGVWGALNSQERDLVLTRFAVEVADKSRFARIVDVQGVNESTPGTTGGAQLGGLVGQTQYLDKTNWQKYSATNQVAWGVVGTLIGAMLDAPPRAAYRFVYTLKAADGSIRTVENVSQSPIHVTLGLCVDTASLAPVRDNICDDSLPEEIRLVFGVPTGVMPSANVPAPSNTRSDAGSQLPQGPPAIVGTDIIFCRLGATSTVSTTAEKCLQAGGNIQP